MRLSTFNSSQAKKYLIFVGIFMVLGVIGIEIAVRKMPVAYCKHAVNDIHGCSSLNTLKLTLTDDSTRLFLGDSHVEYLVDHRGFRDYAMPAMLPTEMLTIMRRLVKTRDIDYTIIGMAAHHLQDKNNTRLFDLLAPKTFERQWLPLPVHALERSLTVGVKRYIWDTLFRRPLPVVSGVQTVPDHEAAAEKRQRRQQDIRVAGDQLTQTKLWWQSEPIIIKPHRWQTLSQAHRDEQARRRFRHFYPHRDYKNIDEHDALTALLDLLESHEINTCFVRFPHTKEFETQRLLAKNSRYNKVQEYVESMIEQRGFKYIDTASLNLELKSMHFRNSDHLLIPVIEALTPVLVDACYPDLPPESAN